MMPSIIGLRHVNLNWGIRWEHESQRVPVTTFSFLFFGIYKYKRNRKFFFSSIIFLFFFLLVITESGTFTCGSTIHENTTFWCSFDETKFDDILKKNSIMSFPIFRNRDNVGWSICMIKDYSHQVWPKSVQQFLRYCHFRIAIFS